METLKQRLAATDVPGDAESSTSSSVGASRVEGKETAVRSSTEETVNASFVQIPVNAEVKSDQPNSIQDDIANGLFYYSRFAEAFGQTETPGDADLERIKIEFDRLPFPPEQQLSGVRRDSAGKVRPSSSSSDFSSFSIPADAITRRILRNVTTVERFQRLLPSTNENAATDEASSRTSVVGRKTNTSKNNLDVLTTEKITHVKEKLEYVEPIASEDFSSAASRRNSDEESKSAEFITRTIVLRSERDEEMQYGESVPASWFKGGRPTYSATGIDESRSQEEKKKAVVHGRRSLRHGQRQEADVCQGDLSNREAFETSQEVY
ncbi:hypothetical protein MTO96_009284 [Rhipicephalus appendiculatus]